MPAHAPFRSLPNNDVGVNGGSKQSVHVPEESGSTAPTRAATHEI